MLWGIIELRVTLTNWPSVASMTGLGTLRSLLNPAPNCQVGMRVPSAITADPPMCAVRDAVSGPR
jgi:hypothetical protein